MVHGYGGHILRVDLSSGRILREKTDPDFMLDVIGGRGLNSRRLYDELKRDIDPLSEENMLLIGVGPVTGSLFSTSAYMTISGKSPLTGILGDSAAGGFFGPEIKYAGYDQLIFTGRSDRLSYVYICDDHVEIRDAAHLKGQDIFQTTAIIRKELNDNNLQIAAIGPAGENLVRYAIVACNNSRVCGRTGMGCLFGSKNLKAVVVKGTGMVSVADPLTFMKLCKVMDNRIMTHPEFQDRHDMGSTLLMNALNGLGILPVNHFQRGVAPYVDKISGQTLAKQYKTKNKGCFNCNINCSRYYVTPAVESEGPEYETLCSFSSRIGNDNLEFALKMNHYLNRMGLDSLSAGETIGWAMECVERGIFNKDDFDGLEFTWGNRETIEKILQLIIRQEGIGADFAKGTRYLANKMGKGSETYALHVKGLDIICGDPRGIKAFGLTYAIASRGADHLRAEPFFELTNRFDEARKRFGTRDAADRLSDNGKAILVEYTERQALLTDCLTMCKNVGLSMDILDFEMAAALLTAGTGLKFAEERVNKALRKTITHDRLMNIDFGITAKDDTLPHRFTHEPLLEGASKNQVVPIHDMVEDYYKLKGWDKKGVPQKP
ncbi:aldehyde ferredoxin oxidoreductase family protein [Desulfobacula sp.]|uniref:aldehyde ferredoxin oxidoreductase family protein n=1 Tax=Desulfobacula sp. TaxID=2593537 RepID=UPI002603A536|nr:aldehyde ferredoxin oxidoreductase family protein [Desulfobacula sp.]